jgi:hypothetical protein
VSFDNNKQLTAGHAVDPDKDYYPDVIKIPNRLAWRWTIRRKSGPMGILIQGEASSEKAAQTAGKKATADLVKSIKREQAGTPKRVSTRPYTPRGLSHENARNSANFWAR